MGLHELQLSFFPKSIASFLKGPAIVFSQLPFSPASKVGFSIALGPWILGKRYYTQHTRIKKHIQKTSKYTHPGAIFFSKTKCWNFDYPPYDIPVYPPGGGGHACSSGFGMVTEEDRDPGAFFQPVGALHRQAACSTTATWRRAVFSSHSSSFLGWRKRHHKRQLL